MNNTEPYVYVFIRTDIPIAQQLVQVGHACLEAGFTFQKPFKASNIVLFAVNSEEELIEIHKTLTKDGIQSKMFYEPDNRMGYSSIATEPIWGERRKAMRNYVLWREPVG